MTTSPASYDWLRTIQPDLKALDDTPLTGSSPPFPWDELSARLAKTFEREGFKIQPKELAWRSSDQLLEGLGDSPYALNFTIPTFNGSACWIMPEQEMTLLETWLLTKESHPLYFQDKTLSESFYRFFALETLFQFSQVTFDKTLAPLLKKTQELPSQDSLCLDVSLSLNEQTIWGRLIISPDMRRSWVDHFSSQESTALTQKLAKEVEVQVHLEAGK
ncbi:MAG: hypothetical protein LW832_06775, partial [Parachlamydia sp.]|nr:hypothetical protein [Parachlamydia sp.]